MADPVLRVALPAPVWGLFDYLPPEGVGAERLQPGTRVWVPFGRGRRCGLVVALAESSALPGDRLKRALRLLDSGPLFTDRHLAFLRWAAAYYHHPLGELLFSALPPRLRRGARPVDHRNLAVCLEVSEGAVEKELARSPRQRALVDWLRARGGCVPLAALKAAPPGAAQALKRLEEKGWVARREPPIPEPSPRPPPYELTSQQAEAVEKVLAKPGYHAWLLEGITGSGKTEVYLQLAERTLAAGRSVLWLVPEIGLTPQLVERVGRRLGVVPALLHSGRSETERERDWHRARTGRARLVIGTRSAVLAPLPELGLVVVDEEHDASYKQQEGIRYSARDLALVRAHRAGCPVVLGSATPSLETLKNVREGRYGRLRLTRRVGGGRLPAMRLLDLRGQRLEGGLSPLLLARMRKVLEAGRQVMVFLNRRGYAPVLTCHGCGWLSECPRCDAYQTWHRASGRLICHHCGSERPAPDACPRCGAAGLRPLGQGTERLEQVLRARFPDHPLVRIDRDTTRRRGSLDRLLEAARAGEAALLVGTQMLAKGHHFPGVDLVALVDVDGGLFSADFRAAERTAQLIVQVAGRAGRGAHPGEMILQTRFPDHPLLQTLVRQGYDAFAEAALEERRLAELPPYSHQALLRAAARTMERAEIFLQAAVAALPPETAGVSVWGPVPAPMPRRAGRHRAQVLLQAAARGRLQRLLQAWVPELAALPEARGVRWSLDVDPLDLY